MATFQLSIPVLPLMAPLKPLATTYPNRMFEPVEEKSGFDEALKCG